MWPHLQVIANYDAAARRKFTYTKVPQTPARKRRFAALMRKRHAQTRTKLRTLLKQGYRPPGR